MLLQYDERAWCVKWLLAPRLCRGLEAFELAGEDAAARTDLAMIDQQNERLLAAG